jgi:hypothetical protein
MLKTPGVVQMSAPAVDFRLLETILSFHWKEGVSEGRSTSAMLAKPARPSYRPINGNAITRDAANHQASLGRILNS